MPIVKHLGFLDEWIWDHNDRGGYSPNRLKGQEPLLVRIVFNSAYFKNLYKKGAWIKDIRNDVHKGIEPK